MVALPPVKVPDKAQRPAQWRAWHNALMAESKTGDVKLVKPVRRDGRWMTVAVFDGDYRQETGGTLDLERTVAVLRRAEALMDAALNRLAPARAVGGGAEPPTDVIEPT